MRMPSNLIKDALMIGTPGVCQTLFSDQFYGDPMGETIVRVGLYCCKKNHLKLLMFIMRPFEGGLVLQPFFCS